MLKQKYGVKCFIMMDGTTIIGSINSEGSDNYIVDNVREVLSNKDFKPVSIYKNEDVSTLFKSSIKMMFTPNRILEQSYDEHVK